MSCEKNGKRVGQAARLNGIMGWTNRYLSALGTPDLYRDVTGLAQIPGRIGEITEAALGLRGLVTEDGLLKRQPAIIGGAMAFVLATHALEQGTGAVATAGMRLGARGKPFGRHRGVILRESPFTPKFARAVNRLTGGRLLEAEGYYFFSSGRTWHSQTLAAQVGDMKKTLTKVRSLGVPWREYYFDRSVAPDNVVDVVKGDLDPDTIPGYIGATTPVENITPLGQFKRALFVASWFLIDEGERDEGGGWPRVDYRALMDGGEQSASGKLSSAKQNGSGWPSTSGGGIYSYDRGGLQFYNPAPRQTIPTRSYPSPYRPGDKPLGVDYTVNGLACPVEVSSIVIDPKTRRELAVAKYWEPRLPSPGWKEIIDKDVRAELVQREEVRDRFKDYFKNKPY
jgi:hypothetical protein